MGVEQSDDHSGQRQIGGHRQIDAFGEQHHHLPEGEDDQNGGVVKHLHQIARRDERRRPAADSADHQNDHRRQQRFAVFKQLFAHYAAS